MFSTLNVVCYTTDNLYPYQLTPEKQRPHIKLTVVL